MIFEQSWESGEIPDDWKLASIVPVFNEVPRNYRSVSVTGLGQILGISSSPREWLGARIGSPGQWS